MPKESPTPPPAVKPSTITWTSIWSWLKTSRVSKIVLALVLTTAVVWCAVIFYQTISSWTIGLLATFFLLLGLWLWLQQNEGIVMVLTGSFWIIHTATFKLITANVSFWLVAGLTVGLVLGLITVIGKFDLKPFDYVLAALIIATPLSVILYLPVSLTSLSVLATLPFMVLFPLILNMKPVKPLALVAQATIVGVIGAGLIAATAIMFT